MAADQAHDARPDVAAGSPVPPPSSPYWRFYAEVAKVQVAHWLPSTPCTVLDLSGSPDFAPQLVTAGHHVVSVCIDGRAPVVPARPGRVLPVAADTRSLEWLRTGCLDQVLAEARMLSHCLATEQAVGELFRALRPGGGLLLTVESLHLGLARMAEQGRWAELADVPRSDVVLVPASDGSILRCFWPEELAELLGRAGFAVDWIRPRSVLTPATVELAMEQGGSSALRSLVRTECQLAAEREGESGLHLLASARKPG